MNQETPNVKGGAAVACSAWLGGWRDMESAPKTGSIIVYRDCRIVMAHWDDQKYHSNPKPYWASETSWASVRRDREQPPQAWMPLPNPPNAKLTHGGDNTKDNQ